MENLRPTDNRPPRETHPVSVTGCKSARFNSLKRPQRAEGRRQLVYATCSLAPEEDRAVIQKVIRRFPDTFTIQDLAHKLPFDTPD